MNIIHLKYRLIVLALFAIFIFSACQKDISYVDSYIIKKDGLYGLIDSSGKEIVTPRFLAIEPIGKDGVGLAIIDTIYTSVRDSSSLGFRNIPVLNIKYGYITSEDKFLFPNPSYVKIKTSPFINPIHAFYSFCLEAPFNKGLAIVQDTTTLLYGYIGLNGDTIIPAIYRNAYQFNDGRAAVKLDYNDNNNNSGKWGLINPQGENVCDFIFSHLNTPVNKRAVAKITFINKEKVEYTNNDISKSTIQAIETDNYNDCSIHSLLVLIDENGNIINENLSYIYEYTNYSKDEIAVAIPNKYLNERYGLGYKFINKDGEFIEPLKISDITEQQACDLIESEHFLNELFPEDVEFSNATKFVGGYAAVNLGMGWVYVDTNLIPRGNLEYPTFEDALPFSHGLAGVKLNGKYGYINKDFNIVIPCKYDSCAIAEKNLCRVYGRKKTDGNYSIISYIDRDGNVVWQGVESNDLENYDKKINGKWRNFEYSYIDKNYTPLIIICAFSIILIVFVISKHYKNL